MIDWKPVLRTFLASYSRNLEALETALTRLGGPLVVEMNPKERICAKGDKADCFWLILAGQVEIEDADKHVHDRGAGEIIGEQAFLLARAPKRSGAKRTADLTAHNLTTLAKFDAALIDGFSEAESALWFDLLAVVLSEKLEQATEQRAALTSGLIERNQLLRRFCDETALGTVQRVLDGQREPTSREVVVWFSDIAGFSTWSSSRSPAEVAEMTKNLMGLQMDRIKGAGGEVDKLMGDGLMAYWFCEGSARRSAPADAYRCARDVDRSFREAVKGTDFENLSVRIGLHYGPVSFGDFGTDSRIAVTILGETVNRGSRYEQVHDKALGPVRISPELYAKVLETLPGLPDEMSKARPVQAKDRIIQVHSNSGDEDGVE